MEPKESKYIKIPIDQPGGLTKEEVIEFLNELEKMSADAEGISETEYSTFRKPKT